MITLREVEDKDLIPLSEFLPKGFAYTTKEYWINQFDLWWTSNPAYTPQIPRGWILEKETKPVGFIGNIPIKFLVNGAEKIAVASNSWYVDPVVRGIYSFRLFNEFMNQKTVSLFLFKEEDDENVMKILARYKYKEYILPQSQKEYVYIIDKENLVAIFSYFLFYRVLPKLSGLSELYKRFGMLIFAYIYQKSVTQGNCLPGEEYTSSLCLSCDDTFSRIWEPHLNTCDVMLSRDTETLRWLYLSRFYKRVVIQCHASRDNALAGYMVFDIVRNKTSDMGSMHLVDICIRNNDPRVVASLISFAIETGKQNNAVLLVVWADSVETEMYFRRSFTMRRTAKNYRYVRFSDTETSASKKDNYTVCLPSIYPPQ